MNVVDFDEKYIVSASGDRTIKVRSNDDLVRLLILGSAAGLVHQLLRVCEDSERSQERHRLPAVPRQAGRQRQLGQHHQALGHRVRRLPQGPRGPRGARQVHQVRQQADCERSLRREDQGVGPPGRHGPESSSWDSVHQDSGGTLRPSV